MVPREYQPVIWFFIILLKQLPAKTLLGVFDLVGGKGRQNGYYYYYYCADAVYDIHVTPGERSQVTVRGVYRL